MFSLNFSSADKQPFMASKAKNMPQRGTFLGDRKNFTLSAMFPFQNNCGPYKKLGTLVLFHIFVCFLDQMGSQLAYFLKLRI